MESNYFISVCIPSYNRPEGLKRALESIDSTKYTNEIQIVVCEDFAPKRLQVRAVVEEFKAKSEYAVKYVENEVNYGHGKNWRQCAHQSDGEYLIYMGDDDMFVEGGMDKFIDWLKQHRDLGYVLRAYQTLNSDGSIDNHQYYNRDRFYEPGIEAYTAFFMKSNLMSGYTIKREYTYEFEEDSLDYTLFYQMYLMAEICLKYKSGYCNIPIAQYVGDGVSYFGVNEVEKKYYKPGINAASDFSNIHKFFDVTEFIDKEHNISSTDIIKREFSTYSSYATMHKYRTKSIKDLKICRDTLVSMGLNKSKYFNFYYYALLIFGHRFCQWGIKVIRHIYGGRPDLT